MRTVKAVIQAGGKGTRLYPYSTVLPKALMPVGDSTIVDQLISMFVAGPINDIYITLSSKNGVSKLIESYCGDGSRWGIRIHYVREDKALGTIGPLTLLKEELKGTFVVTNSDVVVQMDIAEFLDFHWKSGAMLSVAVAKQSVPIEYGVIEHKGGRIEKFREKPTERFCVSTGIYCMEAEVFDYIPSGTFFGFDSLVETLLGEGQPVMAFEDVSHWIDIGRVEDLQKAQEQAQKRVARGLVQGVGES